MEVDEDKTPTTKLSGMIASVTCASASEYERILSVFMLVFVTSHHIHYCDNFVLHIRGVLVTSIMI